MACRILELRTTAIRIFALVALATPGTLLAQRGPDSPIQFRIRGTFHDPEQAPGKGGVNVFTASVEGKQWILDIEEADALQGGILGSSVLKRIFPPILTLVGPKELTGQLASPDTAGKSYSMTGQIYVKRRVFRLNSVESSEEESKGDGGSEAQEPSRHPSPHPSANAAPADPESSP